MVDSGVWRIAVIVLTKENVIYVSDLHLNDFIYTLTSSLKFLLIFHAFPIYGRRKVTDTVRKLYPSSQVNPFLHFRSHRELGYTDYGQRIVVSINMFIRGIGLSASTSRFQGMVRYRGSVARLIGRRKCGLPIRERHRV